MFRPPLNDWADLATIESDLVMATLAANCSPPVHPPLQQFALRMYVHRYLRGPHWFATFEAPTTQCPTLK